MNVPPPGVTLRPEGADVAVFSSSAEAIEICTFDANDAETGRYPLPCRSGDYFHGFVPGLLAGTRYGLRAHGAFAPTRGQRFNPNRLLLDPYAVEIDRPFRLHDSLFDTGDEPSATDSAPFMPKAVAGEPPGAAPCAPVPDWDRLIIYELHVRGFSMLNEAMPQALRGTFAGLGHPASISYLQRLGVTAVEVLPCAAWLDERHLPPLGLTNYWGYNPAGFCAPDPRLAPGGFAEIRAAVASLCEAGISTILDVVFNHTAEGDQWGPTVSLRGLDNAGYYRLRPNDARAYVDDAGCGNVLATDQPGVVRLVMDSLRLWASATGAAGFRFDLAPILGRHPAMFAPGAPLLAAIAQDPALRDRLLIAEPWDIGPGGYQLGNFGAPWAEWNDKFRDTTRRFWRGDGGMLGEMATRLAGSADLFAPSHRTLAHGINFVTAHDGFTLRDLVSYDGKHNEANGEQNRDGTGDNHSWNHGVEGQTAGSGINAARAGDTRALLATLLFARGTPMLTMGDEAGRTQGGNNNAYAQDNAVSWLDWQGNDASLIAAAQEMVALRRAVGPLHDARKLTGAAVAGETLPDVAWLRRDGAPMQVADWQDQGGRTLIAALYTPPERVVLVLHAGFDAMEMAPPPVRAGHVWHVACDTAATLQGEAGASVTVAGRSVVLLREQAQGMRSTGASDETVRKLAAQSGLALAWWDVAGVLHQAPVETLRALLAAQRLPAGSEVEARDSLARLAARRDLPALPPSLVVHADADATLVLGPAAGGRDRWLTIEGPDGEAARLRIGAGDGTTEALVAADGRRVTARRIALPHLEIGRYVARVEGVEGATQLTVAPRTCHRPAVLADGGRAWGIAAHLYTLRRDTDQGIGDFTALGELARVAGAEGASLLGLNPIHALFEGDRERASPYHPADRRFLDPIYIDIGALGALAEVASVRAALAVADALTGTLRAEAYVDYTGVWRLKEPVLRAAFAALPRVPAMQAALDAFIAAGSERLRGFALWEALSAQYGPDWHRWPDEARTPDAAGAMRFAAANDEALRYSAFLQFLAEQGLAAAADAAREAGVALGLYRDLAVGCAPDGAEAWAEQGLLLTGASVGAPPDLLGPHGQIWHLPPPDPLAMAEDGYCAFAGMLAANMRHAGALRIDHVMGLARLFLIPDGGEARDGTYLGYRLPDMMGQVALESVRAKCLVVGEDLGTVPPEMEVAMAEGGMLSYRVLWFETDAGAFRAPSVWPARAAAVVSTHDLPTLAGWWAGADIAEQAELGILDLMSEQEARAAREAVKAQLLDLLLQENLLPPPGLETAPMAAIHALIARTPSALALVQADDLAGELMAVNLPGTDRERPNWRRRLGGTAESFRGSAVLAAMRRERP